MSKLKNEQTTEPADNPDDDREDNMSTTTQKSQGQSQAVSLIEVIRERSETEIKNHLELEIESIIKQFSVDVDKYCLLSLFNYSRGISHWDSSQILQALTELNPNNDQNNLLFIASFGGSIEPAYQISKLCKERAKEQFIVAVPRQAKSAATLVAIGADEIHIGSLGELGPIDPQISGLPALGVRDALKTIASLTEEYPKSADMFARYLSYAVTVEQIGYCERLTESAVQYAQRLLATKKQLEGKTNEIAQKLVYEYKHHGFVIDREEAQSLLGSFWVNGNSQLVKFAEKLYQLLDSANLLLNIFRNKQLQIVGSLKKGIWIWDRPNN